MKAELALWTPDWVRPSALCEAAQGEDSRPLGPVTLPILCCVPSGGLWCAPGSVTVPELLGVLPLKVFPLFHSPLGETF